MKKIVILILLSGMVISTTACKKHTRLVMKTSLGDIHMEMYDDKSPETVTNFLHYVDRKFYDGTIFHRVIENFMVQGGGLTIDLMEKETDPPISNEANNGLRNQRGTLAMARTQDINSATSQFFINVADNPSLNNGIQDFGYCVFGEVKKGMDVVDRISKVATRTEGKFQNFPVEKIVIYYMRRE